MKTNRVTLLLLVVGVLYLVGFGADSRAEEIISYTMINIDNNKPYRNSISFQDDGRMFRGDVGELTKYCSDEIDWMCFANLQITFAYPNDYKNLEKWWVNGWEFTRLGSSKLKIFGESTDITLVKAVNLDQSERSPYVYFVSEKRGLIGIGNLSKEEGRISAIYWIQGKSGFKIRGTHRIFGRPEALLTQHQFKILGDRGISKEDRHNCVFIGDCY